MPATVTTQSIGGNGVTGNSYTLQIGQPDAGTTVAVNGVYQQAGNASVNVAGTVTSPGVPGAGSNFWIIVVDYTSGALTAYTSAVSLAACRASISGTQVEIFNQTLTTASSGDLALDPFVTPDNS